MKCLINCKADHAAWTRKYFSDIPAYMLGIATKPLLEFYVEFCALVGIQDVRLIMEDPDTRIENYFGDGAQWNLRISYGTSRPAESLNSILERNRLLVSDDDLLVINGFLFVFYDKNMTEYDFLASGKDFSLLGQDGCGLFSISHGSVHKAFSEVDFEQYAGKDIEIKPLNNVKDLFDLNMTMVHGAAARFIMPSYNNEEGMYIGQNVEIQQDCDIEKPVIFGKNIQLKRYSNIGAGSIIGDNTLVDSNTVIGNSVVYSNTYIGTDLEIRDKIIYKKRIIDPESGEVLDTVDNFLLSEIDARFFREFWLTTLHAVGALILMILMLGPYIIFRPFTRVVGRYKDFFRDQHGGAVLKLKVHHRSSRRMLQKIFFKFSLDKIRRLGYVVIGRMYLVGNYPLEATEDNRSLLHEMPSYRPAVFSYSEMMGHENDDFQSRIDELYYCHHANLWFDFKIIVITLIQRLFRPGR